MLAKARATSTLTQNGNSHRTTDFKDPSTKLIVLSAADQVSLTTMISNLHDYLEEHSNTAFDRLVYTLNQRRSHLGCRVSFPASDVSQLRGILAGTKAVSNRALDIPRTAFVFTGQSAQWPTMGARLIDSYQVFAKSVQQIDEHLRRCGAEFSVQEELRKSVKTSLIHEAYMSQALCTALQIALVDLLASWSIRPSAVVGHSSGEIGCAYAAGFLTATAAAEIAYHRGQVLKSFKTEHKDVAGTMLAIGASREDVQPMIDRLTQGYAVIACVNSPASVTVSGDVAAIAELQKGLSETSLFHRQLKVDMAYHSAHMKRVSADYRARIKHISPQSGTPGTTFHSSLLGRIAESSELTTDYWVANLVSPVLFSDALSTMYTAKDMSENLRPGFLVEVGPHPALKGPAREILRAAGAAESTMYVGTLTRNEDETLSMLHLAGAMFDKAAPLDLLAVNYPETRAQDQQLLVDLPSYPWNHTTRYWHDSRVGHNHLFPKSPRNDILGSLSAFSSSVEPVWRNILRIDEMPWLLHHQMQGMPVFPMAGYIVLAVEAAGQRAHSRNVPFDTYELREFVISAPLVLKEGVDVEITTSLSPFVNASRGTNDVWDEVKVSSYEATQGWVENMRALVAVRNSGSTVSSNVVQDSPDVILRSRISEKKSVIERSATEKVNVPAMYATLRGVGADYGLTFQGIQGAYASDDHAYATLVSPDTRAIMPREYETDLSIHPATLDLFLQVSWPIFGCGRRGLDILYMPTSVGKMTLSRKMPVEQPGDTLAVYASGSPDIQSPKPTVFELFALGVSEKDDPCIHFEELVMTPVRASMESNDGAENVKSLCFRYEWHSLDDATPDDLEESSQDIAVVPTSNGESIMTALSLAEAIIVAASTEEDLATASYIALALSKLTGNEVPSSTLDIADVDNKLVVVVGLNQPSLADVTVDTMDLLQNLFLGATGCIWIHPSGDGNIDSIDGSMIIGMTRSIRSETAGDIVTLGMASETGTSDSASIVEAVVQVIKCIWHNGGHESPYKADREFLQTDRGLLVPRIANDKRLDYIVHNELGGSALQDQPYVQEGRRFKLDIERPGSLNTLYFKDDDDESGYDDLIHVDVASTGVNFKDIVVTMGQLQQPYIGLEVAGTVKTIGKNVAASPLKVGQRVMAMTEGGYCTVAHCRPSSVSPIPDQLSYESACSVPVVYCTAHYALVDLGRLASSDKVLIHAGAGGVGQAAIMLAQHIGAEIFTTVGSKAKKQLLIDTYNIPADHIFYSRDISFGSALRRATDGYGVDVVLNSLAGDLLRETWDCVAPFGRFVEIGKADISRNSRLDMKHFEQNISFASVDLSKVAAKRPHLMRRLLDDVYQLLLEGKIRPIETTIYPMSRLEQAFRTLQRGGCTGKLVVVSEPGDVVRATVPKIRTADHLRADATYLLIGGTGGLGCSMAKWMVTRGARNIVLTSRRAAITPEVQEVLNQAKSAHAHIVVKACDVTDPLAVNTLIQKELSELPPIRGVVQGAMVLKDVLFENMMHEEWEAVVRPKVVGTWNLHHALADSPLDFFVCLGSCTGTIGNRGQSAYAAANVFLDHYTQWRNAQNLPGSATCIDLFAVKGVGYLAREKDREEEVLRTIGGEPINEAEVLGLLAAAIRGEPRRTCDGVNLTGIAVNAGSKHMFWANDARFKNLLAAATHDEDGAGAQSTIALPQCLKTVESADAAQQLIYEATVQKVASVLMLEPDEIRQARSLLSTGLDSLVAIEVKNWIAREADAKVSILEIQTASSLQNLAKVIFDKSGHVTRFR